ncbi:T9SS type A sorting domain-containing protein [bacterium]|nr:T9SS type A sorting domain-containing protein [bacterium]
MRVLILSLIFISTFDVCAQTVDHWWLPERYSGNRLSAMSLHALPGGMVCITGTDSIHRAPPPMFDVKYEFKDLNAHLIDGAGTLQSHTLHSIGPLESGMNYFAKGGFDFGIGGSFDRDILLATLPWEIGGASVHSGYGIGNMALQHTWNDVLETIREFQDARHPDVLQLKSGGFWLVWEAITVLDPAEIPHRYYEAEIRVARFSENSSFLQSFTLGPGYNPRLVQRTDGTVMVLYRTAGHAHAMDSVGLRLAAITTPGGGDAVLERGIYFEYPFHLDLSPELVVQPTTDNRVVVLFDRLDSITVYSCSANGEVRRSNTTAAGNEERRRYLLTDAEGRMVLLWRQVAGEDITWSPMNDGRIFDTIRSIAGTAGYMEWKAYKGGDGNIKYIAHPVGSDSLLIIPNATASATHMRLLFSPAEFWGALGDWTLDADDVLWVAHRTEQEVDSYRSGIYRVQDLSLSSQDITSLPRSIALQQNYPNPFNPSTTIEFTLPTSRRVTLVVTDLYGREVRRLLDGKVLTPGSHSLQFNAGGLPSGVYFHRLTADDTHTARKMMLMK